MMIYLSLKGGYKMPRVNFNLKDDLFKELKIFVIKNNYANMTELFKFWITSALEMQREKDHKQV